MRLVVDCANGAASDLAHRVFEPLGIGLVVMEATPTGSNINQGCGAVHPEALAERVVSVGATLGLALDGDADRSIFANGSGHVLEGDRVLYALALAARRKKLPGSDTVVGTVLTNRGLEKALAAEGILLRRTPVGDRHILAEMRATGAGLGGEASGHYLFRDELPVSDGMFTCLKLLAEMPSISGTGLPQFEPSYQVALNLRLDRPLSEEQLAACQRIGADAAAELDDAGRVVVRPSGTEPVLRIMVDADERGVAESVATSLGKAVQSIVGD
jgi:phosphoglucosamine mutase